MAGSGRDLDGGLWIVIIVNVNESWRYIEPGLRLEADCVEIGAKDTGNGLG